MSSSGVAAVDSWFVSLSQEILVTFEFPLKKSYDFLKKSLLVDNNISE